MMNSNDELQTHLDRIGEWKLFEIDWAHFRNLAVLGLVDLCALSVGVDPKYAWLVRGMTTIDPDNIPKPEEIAELAGYRNEAIEKWERRVHEALNHIAAGTLPIVRNAAPLGGHDPYEAIPDDAEKIVVKVADFVAWATALPTPWELPEEMKRMGPYPEAEEGLQDGNKPLTSRAETTYLNIIAALLDCIAGNLPNVEKHPSFASEAKLIEAIEQHYKGYSGLSQSNLSRKFPEAKRSLQAQ
jgi:hypothetical protein